MIRPERFAPLWLSEIPVQQYSSVIPCCSNGWCACPGRKLRYECLPGQPSARCPRGNRRLLQSGKHHSSPLVESRRNGNESHPISFSKQETPDEKIQYNRRRKQFNRLTPTRLCKSKSACAPLNSTSSAENKKDLISKTGCRTRKRLQADKRYSPGCLNAATNKPTASTDPAR